MVDQAPPDWRAEKVWGSPARAACRGLEPACLAASARVRCSLAYPGSLDRSQLQPEAPLACRKPIPSSVVGQYTSCDTVMSMLRPPMPRVAMFLGPRRLLLVPKSREIGSLGLPVAARGSGACVPSLQLSHSLSRASLSNDQGPILPSKYAGCVVWFQEPSHIDRSRLLAPTA